MANITRTAFDANDITPAQSACQICGAPVAGRARTCGDEHRKALQRARERFDDWPDDIKDLPQFHSSVTGDQGSLDETVSKENVAFSGVGGGIGVAVIKAGLDENFFVTPTATALLALNETAMAIAVGRDIVLVGGIPKSGGALNRGYGTRLPSGVEQDVEGRILQEGSTPRKKIVWPPDPIGQAVRDGLLDPEALDESDAGPALRAAQKGDRLGVLYAARDSMAAALDTELEPRDLVALVPKLADLLGHIEVIEESHKEEGPETKTEKSRDEMTPLQVIRGELGA